MAHRYVVMASAWLEIIVGVAFITAPDVLCVLLFDVKPEGIAMPLACWLGVGLLGLGIASLPGGVVFWKAPNGATQSDRCWMDPQSRRAQLRPLE